LDRQTCPELRGQHSRFTNMVYCSYNPAPPLSRFVDRFWLCSDTPSHPRERILPSGTIELVVNLRDDEIRILDTADSEQCTRLSGAVVSGAYSRFFVIDPLVHASIIGVHFRPGGAYPFLGAPAGELADTHLDLETLWGQPAVELRERLCALATPTERFALLEKALVSRLFHPPEPHGAVLAALRLFEQTGADVRVHDVARRVGLSQRRFIQLFTTEVGLTPKLYSRVRRFQQSRELVRNSPSPDWAQIGLECGYFDQSHLIRDFRAFAGLTPGEYVRRRSEHVLPNHFHVDFVPQDG
jgi:AraC-like DNA-binding protein